MIHKTNLLHNEAGGKNLFSLIYFDAYCLQSQNISYVSLLHS